MTLQYLEALKALGASPSTKFILPLELTPARPSGWATTWIDRRLRTRRRRPVAVHGLDRRTAEGTADDEPEIGWLAALEWASEISPGGPRVEHGPRQALRPSSPYRLECLDEVRVVKGPGRLRRRTSPCSRPPV